MNSISACQPLETSSTASSECTTCPLREGLGFNMRQFKVVQIPGRSEEGYQMTGVSRAQLQKREEGEES